MKYVLLIIIVLTLLAVFLLNAANVHPHPLEKTMDGLVSTHQNHMQAHCLEAGGELRVAYKEEDSPHDMLEPIIDYSRYVIGCYDKYDNPISIRSNND